MAARHLTALTALGALIGCTSPPPAEVGLPEMVWIEPGEVMLGCGPNDDCMFEHRDTWYEDVDGFWMDSFELSVEAYAACVRHGACDTRGLDGCNWDTPDRENHPINCVNDLQARDYCEWAGRRLPSYKEWMRAGRGDSDDSNPWGNEPASCSRANVLVLSPEGYDQSGCGLTGTAPVRSKQRGGSRFGVHNMVGNVREILSDEIEQGEEGEIYYFAAGSHYLTRGYAAQLRAGTTPERQRPSALNGFRCASDDPPP